MFIRNYMLVAPITVGMDDSVAEALEIMDAKKIRQLPVVSGDKLVGMVTEKQILKVSPSPFSSLSVFENRYFLEKLKVSDVMNGFPLALTPDTTIEEAAVYLREHKLGSVPVLDGDRLVGIISITNIFDAMVKCREYDLTGTILVIEAMDRPGLLADVHQLLVNLGVPVKETIYHIKDNKQAKIKLRLATTVGRQLVDSLESMGLTVISD
ncbi:MAG: CBS and ACT domain-containing protein [Desulfotomaculaceae bacterium]|nr:CBS and ACT domain-containing protein [Desulfotomaculaceae bacterium]